MSFRILVTGATGFIGRALCQRLVESGFSVRAAVRDSARAETLNPAVETYVAGEIGAHTSWQNALKEVDTVVHLASGARSSGTSLIERYRAVNVAGTQSLAAAAAAQGVRRLVFMSTIKVNGEQTALGKPFTELDRPQPEDAYAQSKWEAEQMLWEQVRAKNLALTVLRPPIVYGSGVKGNLLALMNLLQRRLPLPLGSIRNQRSLIHIDNLVDAIIACIQTPVAIGKTYLVSDDEDISTPDLIRVLAAALGVPARLFPFPVALLKLGASFLGRSGEIRRLADSLQIDNSKIHSDLGWQPRVSPAEGLAETARWYLKAVNDTPQRGTEKRKS